MKPPKWTDAVPAELDVNSDPLEVAARLGPSVIATSIVQILHAVGIPPLRRAAILAQLVGVLSHAVDKKRIWEAEKLIRGEVRELEDIRGPGPQMEPARPPRPGDPPVRRGRPKRKPRDLL